MSRRGEAALRELRHRVHALEERLGRLESGRAPPGDGRSATPPPPPRPAPACPGCGLPLRTRAGRCRECGVPLRP
ncbi:MAG TPA: hypothetical protein VH880_12395 [Anaeromyxobacteraceae bacterium]